MKPRYIIKMDHCCFSYKLIDIINENIIYIKKFRFDKIKFIYTYLLFHLLRDDNNFRVFSLLEVIEKLRSFDYIWLKENIIDKGNKFNIIRVALKQMKLFYRGDIMAISTFLQGLSWVVNNAGKNIDYHIALLLTLFNIDKVSILEYNRIFGNKSQIDQIEFAFNKVQLNEFGLPAVFFANK